MHILFLDDNIFRTKKFCSEIPSARCTETASGMIEMLQALQESADYVFLDHDLGGKEYVGSEGADTGMEVVRWVKDHLPPVKTFVVHSMNYAAAVRMTDGLQKAGYNVFQVPFSSIHYPGIT